MWSGQLRKSFTLGKRFNVYRVRSSNGKWEVEAGTAHPLAELLSKGSSHGRGSIVARGNKSLRFFSKFGSVIFAKSVSSARIDIPARTFWTQKQLKDLGDKFQKELLQKFQKEWSSK